VNRWIGCLAATASLGCTSSALARDGKLDVSGSFRTRAEAIDGQYRASAPASDAVLLFRLDLLAVYTIGPVKIGAEMLDSRAYFERRNSSIGSNEVDTIEPVQAYIAADLGSGASLQAGRFTMDLGSRRLIARPVSRNTMNAFTGVRLDWKSPGGDKLTAFWTMPQTRLPEDLDGIRDNHVVLDRERIARQVFGAFGSKAGVLGGAAELYGYRFVERDAPGFATRNRRLWTFGARLMRAPKVGMVDYDGEGAWQSGTTRLGTNPADGPDHRVSAWMAHGAIGWTFRHRWSPRLALIGDYASGDGPRSAYGRFDALVGATSFEFGPSALYGLIARSNLASFAVRGEIKPTSRLDAYVAARPIWLASATDSLSNSGVRDATGAAGSFVGTQIDGRVRYWLVPKRLQLGAGVATLFKGGFLRDAPNAPATGNTHFGYLDATLSF